MKNKELPLRVCVTAMKTLHTMAVGEGVGLAVGGIDGK